VLNKALALMLTLLNWELLPQRITRVGGNMSQLAWAIMLVVVLVSVLALGITLIDALYRRKK
jgi:hypothetical protein